MVQNIATSRSVVLLLKSSYIIKCIMWVWECLPCALHLQLTCPRRVPPCQLLFWCLPFVTLIAACCLAICCLISCCLRLAAFHLPVCHFGCVFNCVACHLAALLLAAWPPAALPLATIHLSACCLQPCSLLSWLLLHDFSTLAAFSPIVCRLVACYLLLII